MTTLKAPPWARMSRRTLLRTGIGGAAAMIVSQAYILDAAAQTRSASGGYAFFNANDGFTIEAIVKRLWPSGDTPGAYEIGVHEYIDNALITADQKQQPDYTDGLRQIDSAAQEMHRAPFARLDAEQQDDLLTKMQNDELSTFDEGQGSKFFKIVHAHTMQGLFSDPIYGGNKDFEGWRQVGYPGPFYIISEAQQQSFEPLDMPFQSIVDL